MLFDDVSKIRIPYVDNEGVEFDKNDKFGIAKYKDAKRPRSDCHNHMTETKMGPKKSVEDMIQDKKRFFLSEDIFKSKVKYFNYYIKRMKNKYNENNEVLESLILLEKCAINFPIMYDYIISGVEENKVKNFELINAYSLVLKETMNKLISVEFPLEETISKKKNHFQMEHLEILKKELEAVIHKYLIMELPLIDIAGLMVDLKSLKNEMLESVDPWLPRRGTRGMTYY